VSWRDPLPHEDITTYRIRQLESETERQGHAIEDLARLRRDGAIAVGVLLVALAISQPQIWGMVVSWCAAATGALRDWR